MISVWHFSLLLFCSQYKQIKPIYKYITYIKTFILLYLSLNNTIRYIDIENERWTIAIKENKEWSFYVNFILWRQHFQFLQTLMDNNTAIINIFTVGTCFIKMLSHRKCIVTSDRVHKLNTNESLVSIN